MTPHGMEDFVVITGFSGAGKSQAMATFEDAGYTLCVLMGKRCAREAVDAAERYLRSTLAAYLREQDERPRTRPAARRGPPRSRRWRFLAGR